MYNEGGRKLSLNTNGKTNRWQNTIQILFRDFNTYIVEHFFLVCNFKELKTLSTIIMTS